MNIATLEEDPFLLLFTLLETKEEEGTMVLASVFGGQSDGGFF